MSPVAAVASLPPPHPAEQTAEEERHGDGSGDLPPFTLNARSAVHRSSRIGTGSGTAPFGIATTTVNPSKGAELATGPERGAEPSSSARAHGSVDSL